MGPSISGLDRLIKMPYGCGEQNMLNFAPTIFVTEYLQNAGQLSVDLKSKSLGFMEKGENENSLSNQLCNSSIWKSFSNVKSSSQPTETNNEIYNKLYRKLRCN